MSKKIFTEREIEMLAQNPCVQSVSELCITYTDEFKRRFIAENDSGRNTREIFEEHGFDIAILGMQRVRSAGKRWRAAYRENGVLGLDDTRKLYSGRPRTKEITQEEIIARLEAQNLLLKAENELLKKVDMAERRLKQKK